MAAHEEARVEGVLNLKLDGWRRRIFEKWWRRLGSLVIIQGMQRWQVF
jgi:hypothetical protein